MAKLNKDEVGSLKAPLRVVPPALIIQAAGPLSQGAERYGSFNWRSTTISLSKHLEAALRHLLAYQDGEDNAPDSGYSHLAHCAAGMAILMDAKAHGTLIDDRVPGHAADLLLAYDKSLEVLNGHHGKESTTGSQAPAR